VRPQVQVGGYFIDFVIEGDGNRRLAVELDGDRYHPPSQWAADQRRQLALERLGWTFWRCWGSHWLLDSQGCLDDLLATLERMGIRPVGGDTLPTAYTEHRLFDVGSTSSAGPAKASPESLGKELTADASTSSAAVALHTLGATALDVAEIVQAGDRVTIRFADDNRVRTFRLSRDAHNPEQGVIHVGHAIAQALLGCAIEEEIDLVVEQRTRRVLIENIAKPHSTRVFEGIRAAAQ